MSTLTLRKGFVVQGGRDSAVLDGEFMNEGVNLVGPHSRPNFRLHKIEGIQHQTSSVSDTFNILFSLEPNRMFLKIQLL
jgi:hypothetical protein